MEQNEKLKKSVYKRWWFWGIIILVAAILISVLWNDNPEVAKEGETNEEQTPTDTSEEIEEGEDNITEQPEVTSGPVLEDTVTDDALTRDNTSAVLTTLNTGTFKVGTDIPAGRYVITGDGSGNLVITSEDGLPYVNEILGGEEIGVDHVTTDIREGDTIEISLMNNAIFTPAETTIQTDTLTTGNWIVGIDIPSGRYDISSTGGSGNLFVYDENGWPEVNEILGGELGVDKVTVFLENSFTVSIGGLKEIKLVER